MTSDRGRAVGLGGCATMLALFGLAGSSSISGPVILALSDSGHGVHLDDLVVVACWASIMVWSWRLWREG